MCIRDRSNTMLDAVCNGKRSIFVGPLGTQLVRRTWNSISLASAGLWELASALSQRLENWGDLGLLTFLNMELSEKWTQKLLGGIQRQGQGEQSPPEADGQAHWHLCLKKEQEGKLLLKLDIVGKIVIKHLNWLLILILPLNVCTKLAGRSGISSGDS